MRWLIVLLLLPQVAFSQSLEDVQAALTALTPIVDDLTVKGEDAERILTIKNSITKINEVIAKYDKELKQCLAEKEKKREAEKEKESSEVATFN